MYTYCDYRIVLRSFYLFCSLEFELGSKDNIPKFRTNSETVVLSAIVMLIMIFLESMEIGVRMLACIQKMQKIMSTIVDNVPNQIS